MNTTSQLLGFLLDSTLAGGGLVLSLFVLQHLGRRWLAPKWLRLAWVMVSLRFLLLIPADVPGTIRLESLGLALTEKLAGGRTGEEKAFIASANVDGEASRISFNVTHGILAIWALGASVSVTLLVVQTLRVHRLLRQRQSTDHNLLELLESAKMRLNIHAPIGLIISGRAGTPMIVGWLRPRIILPVRFAAQLSPPEITRVFVHEISHFKSGDILALWLAAIVRVVHWYNPLAYAISGQLRARQEEACDVRAIGVLRESGIVYGQALLNALRISRNGGVKVSAVTVVSSFHDLQSRVRLLTSEWRFSPFLAAGMILILGASGLVTTTSRASLLPGGVESAREALKNTKAWVGQLDRGDYAGSWKASSPVYFQKPIPEWRWLTAITTTRQPLGALRERRLRTQTFLPVNPDGLKGPFIVTVFDTKFERMADALETATFVLDGDGKWRASAYYLRPNSTSDRR